MRRRGVSTRFKAAAVVGTLVLLGLGLLAATSSRAPLSRIVISSTQVEWGGSSYDLITTPYDNGTAPSGEQDGVDVYIGFSNTGTGFAPNSTFTLDLMTGGFLVGWTEYCINTDGWQGSLLTGYRDYTGIAPIVSPGCVENSYDYSTVPLNSTQPGSLIELVIGLNFPSAAYSGPITFRLV